MKRIIKIAVVATILCSALVFSAHAFSGTAHADSLCGSGWSEQTDLVVGAGNAAGYNLTICYDGTANWARVDLFSVGPGYYINGTVKIQNNAGTSAVATCGVSGNNSTSCSTNHIPGPSNSDWANFTVGSSNPYVPGDTTRPY